MTLTKQEELTAWKKSKGPKAKAADKSANGSRTLEKWQKKGVKRNSPVLDQGVRSGNEAKQKTGDVTK